MNTPLPNEPIFRTIREQVVQRLREDVIGHVFAPGEMLREVALAKRYRVSRSPIREALLQLAQEGLLVALPNRGVRVANKADKGLQELVLDLRLAVECFAVSRAIDRLDESAEVAIRQNLAAFHQACERRDLTQIVHQDMAFHRNLLALADSPELVSLWQPAMAVMMLQYERHRDWMESFREHEAIAEAIIQGDRPAAEEALRANIR